VPIRVRLAVAFTVAVAAVYALGTWLFLSRLTAAVFSSVDSQLAAQLSGAARYLPPAEESEGSPASVPGPPPPGEYVVQVIDGLGRIRGASPGAARVPLLTGTELRLARHRELTLTRAITGEEPERLLAAPVTGRPGWVAVAGVSLESADTTLGDVAEGLLIGGVIFVAATGLGAYGLARAALSPVERLRREAATISGRDLASRLPVPRTRDEVAALAKTMNELLARLQAALGRQRAFVADASHELRTPFAVLRAELELAAKPGRSREELTAAVARAADEAARLARITDDLLLLARDDEGRLSLQKEPVPVRELLGQSIRQPTGRGATCTVAAPAGLTALVDPGRIRQAVDNLVDNALRFAPPQTQVVISAWADGADLVIEVSDQGPGFAPGFLPRAFERFARPDSGRSRSDGGAGLGLAIAAAIARAHGGSAGARNNPGGGAAVTLRLPGAVTESGEMTTRGRDG
jgi:two-component system OmpR family sensor kinase